MANKRIKKNKWVTIPNSKVQMIWVCNSHERHVYPREEAAIPPDWYEVNGTPVCSECDRDMIYVRTEIKK